jgi:hypothetical protein
MWHFETAYCGNAAKHSAALAGSASVSESGTTLSQAIADTNTHMQALHEDTLSRIATVGEGRQARKKR